MRCASRQCRALPLIGSVTESSPVTIRASGAIGDRPGPRNASLIATTRRSMHSSSFGHTERQTASANHVGQNHSLLPLRRRVRATSGGTSAPRNSLASDRMSREVFHPIKQCASAVKRFSSEVRQQDGDGNGTATSVAKRPQENLGRMTTRSVASGDGHE